MLNFAGGVSFSNKLTNFKTQRLYSFALGILVVIISYMFTIYHRGPYFYRIIRRTIREQPLQGWGGFKKFSAGPLSPPSLKNRPRGYPYLKNQPRATPSQDENEPLSKAVGRFSICFTVFFLIFTANLSIFSLNLYYFLMIFPFYPTPVLIFSFFPLPLC